MWTWTIITVTCQVILYRGYEMKQWTPKTHKSQPATAAGVLTHTVVTAVGWSCCCCCCTVTQTYCTCISHFVALWLVAQSQCKPKCITVDKDTGCRPNRTLFLHTFSMYCSFPFNVMYVLYVYNATLCLNNWIDQLFSILRSQLVPGLVRT